MTRAVTPAESALAAAWPGARSATGGPTPVSLPSPPMKLLPDPIKAPQWLAMTLVVIGLLQIEPD